MSFQSGIFYFDGRDVPDALHDRDRITTDLPLYFLLTPRLYNGFSATLGAVLFSHGAWSDLWIYVVGPFAGAGVAAAVHRLQARREPVPPEVSERSQIGQ